MGGDLGGKIKRTGEKGGCSLSSGGLTAFFENTAFRVAVYAGMFVGIINPSLILPRAIGLDTEITAFMVSMARIGAVALGIIGGQVVSLSPGPGGLRTGG